MNYAKLANKIRKPVQDAMETLSKGYGKFDDAEAALFKSVKQKLGGEGTDAFKEFASEMGSARSANAQAAKNAKNQPDFRARKQARIDKANEEAAARMQVKYRQMGQAHYDAGAPQAAPSGPNYNAAKGQKTYTKTWAEQVQDSHKRRTGAGMSDPNNPVTTDLVTYTDPQTRRRQMIDQMAEAGLKRQRLNDANKTGWDRFKDRVSDKITGSGFNSKTTQKRREYNDFLFSQGRENEYVRSNKAFQQMQEEVGIHGRFDGKAEGFDSIRRVSKAQQEAAETTADAARIAKENAEGNVDLSGIAAWAQENQLIVAGGLVAGTLLLTDD